MRNVSRVLLPSDRRAAIEAVLTEANTRTAMVRQRDDANRIARGGGSPANQLGLAPAMQDHARAESARLTAKIGAIPNIGRAVRRSLARQRVAGWARAGYSYPLPVPVAIERKPSWGAREQARRVRQMARGAVLSA